jgi:hypothetical protein
VFPFLRIVTDTGVRAPRRDLAPVIRDLCTKAWKEAGGCDERLYLHLEPLVLDLDRVGLLTEAVRALLTGGLSPQFATRQGALAVHLWPLDGQEEAGMLLIADSGTELSGEPSTAAVQTARHYAEKAGCKLIWRAARGAVWWIYIPLLGKGGAPSVIAEVGTG